MGNPYPDTAISKLIAVVEVLDRPRALSAISGLTGLNISTAHRILTQLIEHGWVERDEDRRYVPTGKLRQTGHRESVAARPGQPGSVRYGPGVTHSAHVRDPRRS